MKISACLIAKNEEKVIARCIESYRTAVDEIIVVDTGSTDQTVTIAKKLGAKVFYYKWINDFAAAKNYALSKAKGDWIVFLDADEYFGGNTGSNIRSVLQKIDSAYDGILCKMINIDRVTGKISDEITQIRVFRNDKHIRYENPIHEHLRHKKMGGKVHVYVAAPEELMIYHTGYSNVDSREKAVRNLEILLRQLPEAPKKPEYYQYIADCYVSLKEWDKVIEYTNLAMEHKVEMPTHAIRPYHNLIDAMLGAGYPVEKIMAVVNTAIKKYPDHPLFYFYRGNLLYDEKRYDAACREYRKALQLHESYNSIEINPLPANLWLIYNKLGIISEYRGDYQAAVEYYQQSLALDNDNVLCFDRLMMLIRTQPPQDIIVCLNSLYDRTKEADLNFLTTNLVNHPVPKVLAYYTSLRQKRYPQEDFVVLNMLAANGYYDKAFPVFLSSYSEDGDERLAAAAAATALLSGNEAYVGQCMAVLPPVFTDIIKAFCGAAQELALEALPAYRLLVKLFTLWGTPAALGLLIELLYLFSDKVQAAMQTGRCLLDDGYYNYALSVFDWALEQADAMPDKVLHYSRGYCLHQLNHPAAAVEAFIKAYEAGYRVNDIYEFLRWNVDKLGEGSVKKQVEKILQAEKSEMVN